MARQRLAGSDGSPTAVASGSGSPSPRAGSPHARVHRELLAAAESGDARGYLSAVEHHSAPLEAMLAQLD